MSALVNGDVKSTLPITLNIDSILNSKIKIKPKPGSEVIIPAGSTQWMSTRATNQVPVSSHQTISMVTPSTNISGGNITAVTDDKSMKRAQRIIKNRESASLSRKKKKEYMTSLEDRLQQCRGENERLQKENENLRQRLQSLQQENSGLKYPNLSPAKKICLMCVGCLLVVNISLFSFISAPTSTSSRPDVTSNSHITGRHLMSMEVDKSSSSSKYNQDIPTNEDMWSTSVLMQFDEELSLLAEKLNITGKLGNMCPMYFNSTESNRLAEQLRMWMISHEEEKKKTEKKQQNKKKDYPPLRRFGPGSFRQQNPGSEIHSPTVTEHIYSVQVFSGGSDPRQKLLNAISRRNDTFYVFSFSTDYFLIPATAHNKTMRPRMSLLMPVVTPSVNETTNRSQNSIGMMQIDCEILSTNIINVHRSAFPEDNHYNSTSYKHQENSNKPVRNSNNASMHPKQKETNITDKIQEQSDWGKLRKSRSG
uniref:BZIP domain-containing protein n=1 Tax=Arion vulgaris TaxID=1028688 RepID=A0A0B7A510_9EUPU